MITRIITILFFITVQCVSAQSFDILTPKKKVTILYDQSGPKLDSIAAALLANDVALVTGFHPEVTTRAEQISGNVIVIGNASSELINSFDKAIATTLKGKSECYSYTLLNTPTKKITQALIVAGSDARGTAYGVFGLSEKMGVSPWYWWADVHPDKKETLSIVITDFTSQVPSVAYRGIFINDEDWGLQPWAAKTLEPETGDIGPKTYQKVFELLLRLRANLIWPAMHDCTKAFFNFPGNIKMAEDYCIVLGSSHAEPMLRNNVGEWNEKTDGHFNYISNKDNVYNYWETRVKQAKNNDVIYTMGMRGVHDSAMEGVKDDAEAIPLLEQIFTDQRNLFAKYINKDVTKVPQAFTLYKEVLEIYDKGLKVPDDITLVWPDDNYGYIRRLSNETEKQRKGGSGVYYHASYWGRPHDYLWLSTAHPGLMREEMMKAFKTGADKIWVLNVGDIKPAEYDMQLFLDMAYNAKPFIDTAYSDKHMVNWYASAFGAANATKIAAAQWKFYNLAFERKPEYMGWSQTEPTTKTKITGYNTFAYGDQAQKRIDAYKALEFQVREISKSIPQNREDAFYELIEYPITGSSLMNQKFLYRDKAVAYSAFSAVTAAKYAGLSAEAFEKIQDITEKYNALANGKWQGIMSMAPRKLPVFDSLTIPVVTPVSQKSIAVLPEGGVTKNADGVYKVVSATSPQFDRWNKQKYFIDVILQKDVPVQYRVKTSAPWIKAGEGGVILPTGGRDIQRLWIEIDWAKAPQSKLEGSVIVTSENQSETVTFSIDNRNLQELEHYKGYIASGDYIAINAADYSERNEGNGAVWKTIKNLGGAGTALEAFPLYMQPYKESVGTDVLFKNAAVNYDFYTFDAADATVTIITLPTLPLNDSYRMRYAVRIDDGPVQILDFKTVGRSEEWKQNVLGNAAERELNAQLRPGKHRLTIYTVDPGVILDRIFINLGEAQPFYGTITTNTKF